MKKTRKEEKEDRLKKVEKQKGVKRKKKRKEKRKIGKKKKVWKKKDKKKNQGRREGRWGSSKAKGIFEYPILETKTPFPLAQSQKREFGKCSAIPSNRLTTKFIPPFFCFSLFFPFFFFFEQF